MRALLFALCPLALPLPAQAGQLSGVVRTEQGEILTGVGLYAYDLRLGYTGVNSDHEGAFRFDDLPTGLYRLRAVPADGVNQVERYWPDAWSFCEGELLEVSEDGELADVDFSLPQGALLSGQLLDSAGAPISGAELTVEGAGLSTTGLARQGSSDEDGSFQVAGLDVPESETGAYTCGVEVEGWPDQYHSGVYDDEDAQNLSLPAQGSQDLGSWQLLDGVGAQGTIQGPEGGVENANVHIYGGGQVISVISEQDGVYEGWAVPPGQVLVWSSAEGHGTTYYPDADRPESYLESEGEGTLLRDVDLQLPAEATLSGRLVGDGLLDGITVLLYNSTNTVGRGALVDEDGSFIIDALHGGDYTLYVYGADEGWLDDYVRDSDGSEAVFSLEHEADNQVGDIVLAAGAVVEGQVTDEQGDPVYGAYVYAVSVQDEVYEVVSADSEGNYTLAGLTTGSWQLYARYAHYCLQDPGYVTVYWQDQVYDLRAEAVQLVQGESLQADFVLPGDDDHDEMGDSWEQSYGLDTGRDDAAEDPDGDGYTNLEEYRLGTDPTQVYDDGEGCGCRRNSRALVGLPLLVLPGWLRKRRRGERRSAAR